jgi:hypothetical protein
MLTLFNEGKVCRLENFIKEWISFKNIEILQSLIEGFEVEEFEWQDNFSNFVNLRVSLGEGYLSKIPNLIKFDQKIFRVEESELNSKPVLIVGSVTRNAESATKMKNFPAYRFNERFVWKLVKISSKTAHVPRSRASVSILHLISLLLANLRLSRFCLETDTLRHGTSRAKQQTSNIFKES